MIRVLSLVENTVTKADFIGEHGLSMWIEIDDRRILFDTGQGIALLHNAQILGVDLGQADAVVLSHGHYDHTGGVAAVLERAKEAKVYAHPDVFCTRYTCPQNGSTRDIGIREANKSAIQKHVAEVVDITEPVEVTKGLFATGPVPRMTEYEDTGGPFFLDKDRCQPDPLTDDQALFFESDGKIVVLLGCAHAGVVNTLTYIRHLTNDKPIHTVIGGMHLHRASKERLEKTVAAFEQMNIRCLCPAHCTGPKAVAAIRQHLPDACEPWPVGTEMTFPGNGDFVLR